MRCLECGAEIAERAQVCARCGSWAPVEYQLYVAEDLADAAYDAAGGPSLTAIHADVSQQRPESAPDQDVDGAELAEWAATREFGTTRLRPGYDIGQVDAFISAIRDTFLGVREPCVTPDEIRKIQFSITRLRPGYDEKEVDAFLDEAGSRLAEDARPGTVDPYSEAIQAADEDRVTSPSVRRPPIRRVVAFTGAGTALLAGAAGLVSQLLLYTSYDPGVYFFGLAAYLVPIGVALAALRRIDRLVVTGLLQGMWWPAVAYVASDIPLFSVDHMFGLTGLFLAGIWIGVVSDVLGAGAAVVLLIAWSPAVGWRPFSRLRPLPAMLLCGVALSQIVILISAFTQQGKDVTSETWAIAGLLVGLIVTWYAVNLRANALGGALVLGWCTVTAFWSLAGMSPWTATGVLGCALLAAVVVLALIYMRLPDMPASERRPADDSRFAKDPRDDSSTE